MLASFAPTARAQTVPAPPVPSPSAIPVPSATPATGATLPVATRNAGTDFGTMFRSFSQANPCDEPERSKFLGPRFTDDDGKTIFPIEHFVESFKGHAVSCPPDAFTRTTYLDMFTKYEDLLRTEAAPPPLVLWIHGGLVPGLAGFKNAADRMCDLYPASNGCKDFREESIGSLRGFPVFVIWHSGFAEALTSTIFSSRTRETSAHGMVDRVKHRPIVEQEMFDRFVTHDDDPTGSSRYNLNHTETLFRTYNYLSTPNLWHFMQDEIADTFALPGDPPLTAKGIDNSKQVGLWLVRSIAKLHQRQPFGRKLRVVIVGHSMGAEYASWLIETYDRYVRDTRLTDDLQFDVVFMAPAVPYTTFERALRTGRVSHFRMFTMDDAHERADHLTELDVFKETTKAIYPYSLLYFISGVLNPYPDYPLLGLRRYGAKSGYVTTGNAKNSLVITDVQRKLSAIALASASSPETADFEALSPTLTALPWKPAGMRTCSFHHGDFGSEVSTMQSIKWLVNVEWSPYPPAVTAPPPYVCQTPPPETAQP
jgi:pimeloyl-ACP methyl ester carboxylesterase